MVAGLTGLTQPHAQGAVVEGPRNKKDSVQILLPSTLGQVALDFHDKLQPATHALVLVLLHRHDHDHICHNCYLVNSAWELGKLDGLHWMRRDMWGRDRAANPHMLEPISLTWRRLLLWE